MRRFLILSLALFGCDAKPVVPACTMCGGNTPAVVGSRGDAGALPAPDSSLADAASGEVLTRSCQTLGEAGGTAANELVLAGALFNESFPATHVVGEWVCGAQPTLRIRLKREGACSPASSDAVFALQPVGTPPLVSGGTVSIGEGFVGVTVPTARGAFGTCTGATGTVTIAQGDLSAGLKSLFFNLSLVDCSGSGSPAHSVSGQLSVTMSRGYAEACSAGS